MTDPRALLAGRQLFDRAWAGTIAEDAGDVSDLISVIIPDFDAELTWGPCIWMPRGDVVTMPLRGDPCLIMFDNNRAPWIIAWRPQ